MPTLLSYALVPVLLSLFLVTRWIPEVDFASPQCSALSLLLSNKVAFPTNAVYTSSLDSYFSVQGGSLQPACIVNPTTAAEVSTIVKSLAFLQRFSFRQCQFAIRSGGHTHWAGAANIHEGVVIDLKHLNDVVPDADGKITAVGPAATWGKVYMLLDQVNLSVVGGRNFDVGVGGLLTGGGISFFSPQFGLACDNVQNYEVVLADGSIVNANANENPDLFLGLKGGSNNLGIVTRFDLKTFPQGKMWGGNIFRPVETLSQTLDAFTEFAGAKDYDEHAALIHTFGYGAAHGYAVASSLEYAKEEAMPAVFKELASIEPQWHNTMRLTNLSDLTLELSTLSPLGQRHSWAATTFKNDRDMMNKAIEAFNGTIAPIMDVPGLQTSLVFQPIPVAITEKSGHAGGNSLGLDATAGPLVLALIVTTYASATDDSRVTEANRLALDGIDTAAKEAGLYHPFIYLNYAASHQDPIAGYGTASRAHLQRTSRKYDPSGVFQKCVPGGYKLF
ncbi:FAD binding domain-containing protein [Phlyctema vagabunda]|uniref:FAD binding domain-containing protein n=1 Tax=Phlyctema vagabunda TaxID=108571 RepID=A0ABR4PEA0_9HELO